MGIEGTVTKAANLCFIKIPLLDASFQGSANNAVKELKNFAFKHNLIIQYEDSETFTVFTKNPNALLALILKKQRKKHNLSLRDVMKKLGYKSKTSYSRYENGENEISIAKFDMMFSAITNNEEIILT